MLVETNQMMPIAKLQKSLNQTIKNVSENNEIVYILENDTMEAVMIPFEKYEYLSALEEAFEEMEISETIKNRMKNYDAAKSADWESIRAE